MSQTKVLSSIIYATEKGLSSKNDDDDSGSAYGDSTGNQ